MINTVRTWTKKPARPLFAAIEREERSPEVKETKPRLGFFESFAKMWEAQADLAIRNLQD